MDRSYESLVSASEFRPMLSLPHKLSQLNRAICGCRCSCGCACAGYGDGDGSGLVSDSDTAVESCASDHGEDFLSGPQAHNNDLNGTSSGQPCHTVVSPRALSHRRIALFLEGAEGTHIGESPAGWEHRFIRSPLHDDHEEIPESLFNEAPSTENQSDAVSDRGSVQMVSPGPGIGSMFPENTWAKEVQLVYFFHATPLRLSAEYQHARGRAVEHLLVPDEESFVNAEH